MIVRGASQGWRQFLGRNLLPHISWPRLPTKPTNASSALWLDRAHRPVRAGAWMPVVCTRRRWKMGRHCLLDDGTGCASSQDRSAGLSRGFRFAERCEVPDRAGILSRHFENHVWSRPTDGALAAIEGAGMLGFTFIILLDDSHWPRPLYEQHTNIRLFYFQAKNYGGRIFSATSEKYEMIRSAPARLIASNDSITAASRSIHPWRAAASSIEYSPLT